MAVVALGDAEVKFRSLRRGPLRQAIKLETFWWHQLEVLAGERSLSVSELVFEFLQRAPASENKTAFVRRCIAAGLLAEARRSRRGPGAALLTMLRDAPYPAFIASDSEMVDINPQGLRELERRLLKPARLKLDTVEIRTPAAQALMTTLRSAKDGSAEIEARLRVEDAAVVAPVRATLFPDAARWPAGAADWAFCFLL